MKDNSVPANFCPPEHRSGDRCLDRREFLKTGMAASLAVAVANTVSSPGKTSAQAPSRGKGYVFPFNERTEKNMPTRNFGKTGYRVGIFSLGGQATVELPEKEAEATAIVNRAIDLGVNYIDTAAAYGRGISETYIGKVLKTRRKEVFLASKTNDRTYDGTMKLLEASLQHLNTDHLDLYQLHNVQRIEELDQIFAKDGAIQALEKARSQGVTRFLGITGHFDPFVLVEGLKRYPFDTLLMAVNAADRHYMSFIEHLLPVALELKLGIIAMKIAVRGRMLSSWTPPPPEQQPERLRTNRSGTLTMKEALYYDLTLPVSTVIVGCDNVRHVEENVAWASEFTPLSEKEMHDLELKTFPIQRQALYFRKWTA